jgi:hypothetical protein
MPNAKNIIKIDVKDEDENDEFIKSPQKEKNVFDVAKRSKKVLATPKKEIKNKKNEKSLEKKSLEKKPENIMEKVSEINPVKKMVLENSPISKNNLNALKEIKDNKKEELIIGGQKTYNTVKDVVNSALKENKNKLTDDPSMNIIKPKKSIKLYKNIALTFIFLTLALATVVTYFLIVKVTIILIPNQERMSNNMIVDVKDKDKNPNSSDNSIKGVVTLLNMEQKAIFTASGTEVIGEEAVGKVKIINNYTKNQPLVASTRLLPPDGNKLFRLKSTVNVPAGGSTEAEIYADDPTPDSAVGPTKFTFPGLWAGLQDKIYAENSEPIIYQQKVKRKIVQADIDLALQDLRNKILDDAKLKINETYKVFSQIMYKIDEDSVKSEIEGNVGDEKDYFNAKMEANVITVAFQGQDVAAMAKQKFISSLPENKELISFDENNIIYSLNNYNYADGVATINVTFEGKTTLKENSKIINTDTILGLNKKELDAYLSGLSDIAGFEVIYYPSFIKRVPNLVDRIKIEIKK